MCQTPSKVHFFMILGHLLLSYYVAQNTRAIGRKYTAITGYLLITIMNQPQILASFLKASAEVVYSATSGVVFKPRTEAPAEVRGLNTTPRVAEYTTEALVLKKRPKFER